MFLYSGDFSLIVLFFWLYFVVSLYFLFLLYEFFMCELNLEMFFLWLKEVVILLCRGDLIDRFFVRFLYFLVILYFLDFLYCILVWEVNCDYVFLWFIVVVRLFVNGDFMIKVVFIFLLFLKVIFFWIFFFLVYLIFLWYWNWWLFLLCCRDVVEYGSVWKGVVRVMFFFKLLSVGCNEDFNFIIFLGKYFMFNLVIFFLFWLLCVNEMWVFLCCLNGVLIWMLVIILLYEFYWEVIDIGLIIGLIIRFVEVWKDFELFVKLVLMVIFWRFLYGVERIVLKFFFLFYWFLFFMVIVFLDGREREDLVIIFLCLLDWLILSFRFLNLENWFISLIFLFINLVGGKFNCLLSFDIDFLLFWYLIWFVIGYCWYWEVMVNILVFLWYVKIWFEFVILLFCL